MTIEDLRQKPVGVLEVRTLSIIHKGSEYEEPYFLGKMKNGKYFIGFSTNGCYCSKSVCEVDMLKMINDKEISNLIANDIYLLSPQLSCWMD